MSNDEMTDAEHEASECLRRRDENEKRIKVLKEDIKEKPDPRSVEIAELRGVNKQLLAGATKLAKEGRQMIAKTIDGGDA